jgi:hypothetical protein
MVKCETCIYRKNCQFLGRHPKAEIAECTAYESEEKLKNEAAREILDALNEYTQHMLSESKKRNQYDDTDYYKGKVSAFHQVRDFAHRELKKCMEE